MGVNHNILAARVITKLRHHIAIELTTNAKSLHVEIVATLPRVEAELLAFVGQFHVALTIGDVDRFETVRWIARRFRASERWNLVLIVVTDDTRHAETIAARLLRDFCIVVSKSIPIVPTDPAAGTAAAAVGRALLELFEVKANGSQPT